MLNKQKAALKFALTLSVLASVTGCRAGGGITATPAQAPYTATVTIPTIAIPAANPFYSKDDTLSITGMCMTGHTVTLSGDENQTQICQNSAYSFSVLRIIDGLFSFQITQTNDSNTSSLPVPFVWVRKTSVAPPTILTPAVQPFLSAQAALTMSGSCESGATVKLSSDGATKTTTCAASAFAFNLPKASDGDYTIVIEQTDRAGNIASSSLIWKKYDLTLSPNNPSLVVGTAQPLTIGGGTGFYAVTVLTNGSGGTYNAGTTTYTTGTLAGATDTLRITDTLGAMKTLTITTVAGAPDHLMLPTDSGDGQTKAVGKLIDLPAKVKVVDRYGNGIQGYQLRLNVETGDAKIIGSRLRTTDSQGLISVNIRMGHSATTNKIFVSSVAGNLPDVAASGNATLTLTENAVASGNGQIGTSYTVGQNPGNMALTDLNGDGKNDIVVINGGDPSLGILIGKGNGLYASMVRINGLCNGATGVAAADLNGDLKIDLVVTCGGSDSISIYIGRGDGTFMPPASISTSPDETLPTAVVIADLDADSKQDLIVTSAGGSLVAVFKGRGDGTFNPAVDFNVGLSPTSLAVGDINKDGKLDIVVTNAGDNTIGVLLGDGLAGLGAQTAYGVGVAPVGVAVADFNKDGWDDVLVTNNGEDTTSILLNDTAGVLDFPNPNSVGGSPTALVVGDFNSDGNLDFATSNSGDNTASLVLGLGNGLFNNAQSIGVLGNPVAIEAKDTNADGTLDLFLSGNGEVQVLPLQAAAVVGYKIAVGATPGASATADFDEDGNLDVVIANVGGNSVSVLSSYGNGFFRPALTLATGTSPAAVTTADLDNDGHMDFIVANQGSGSVRVFMGKGDGTFQTPTDFTVASGPDALVAEDFNGDGLLDLAVAASNASKVSILVGNGDGTFQPRTDVVVGAAPIGIIAADLNGDHMADLVTANSSSNDVSVLIGNGDATFRASVEYTAGNGPVAIATADFDNDGKSDVAVLNGTDGSVSILKSVGDGGLTAANDFSCGLTPTGLVIGDFNGDARLDLAVTNGSSTGFTILNGSGNGFFNSQNSFTTEYSTSGLAVGDFNGDGALDLTLLDLTNSKADVWLGH
jgi:hypothetical protein